MIGLAVSQARADRVGYTIDRCFGASCVGGSVRVGELSLAFTESSLGVVDSAASATVLGNFTPELRGISGTSFAGAEVKQSSETSAAQRANAENTNPTSVLLPGSGVSLALSRMEVPAFETSIDLAGAVSPTGSGSFSVTGVSLNAVKGGNPLLANGLIVGGAPGGQPGVVPTGMPEPTTMLLFGTGLAGAAAIVRKRLKGSRR